MIIDSFNLSLLRVFEAVYRTQSMTKAAEELHMTQSGASQSIKNLELALDIKLFNRFKQKLIPTQDAKELYTECYKSLHRIENAISSIKGHHGEIRGEVSIGVPIEFGNNVVLPKISDIAKENPDVNFQITYALPKTLNQLILEAKVDFAFVDSYQFDPSIELEKVSEENLLLCCSLNYYKKVLKERELLKTNYQKLDYIAYDKEFSILSLWFLHHLNIKRPKLTAKIVLHDVQGVKTMIINDLGLGVLPEHVLLKYKNQAKKIVVIKGKKALLKNSIAIAYLRDRHRSKAEDFILDKLKEMT